MELVKDSLSFSEGVLPEILSELRYYIKSDLAPENKRRRDQVLVEFLRGLGFSVCERIDELGISFYVEEKMGGGIVMISSLREKALQKLDEYEREHGKGAVSRKSIKLLLSLVT